MHGVLLFGVRPRTRQQLLCECVGSLAIERQSDAAVRFPLVRFQSEKQTSPGFPALHLPAESTPDRGWGIRENKGSAHVMKSGDKIRQFDQSSPLPRKFLGKEMGCPATTESSTNDGFGGIRVHQQSPLQVLVFAAPSLICR